MSDVLIIGGGIAALVAAAYVKRAGRSVAVMDEGLDGSAALHDAAWFPQSIADDLGLERYGYAAAAPQCGLVFTAADRTLIELTSDIAASATAIGRLSRRDAERWPAFCTRISRLAGLLEEIYRGPPPNPMAQDFGSLVKLGKLGLRARSMGREGIEDLLRLLPMAASDFLDEWFESDPLKGALAAVSVRDLAQGPRSGGTVFNFLHHCVGHPSGTFGAHRSDAGVALRKLLEADLRSARIARIEVARAAVTAAVTDRGEKIEVARILSEASPLRTLTGLVDPGHLDPELVRALRQIRSRGVAARLRVRFERAPQVGSITIARSADDVERAYDEWKYGHASTHPVISAAASVDDPVVFDAHVQYVPFDLPAESRQSVRSQLTQHVGEELARAFGIAVTEARVWLPDDLVEECEWPQGQPHHAELALDQILWMRPVPALADYTTPIRGLCLCGPAMHPGVPALCGRNAASVLLSRDGR